MDAAEAAVAEHADHIAWSRPIGDVVDDALDGRQIGRGFPRQSEVLHQLLRVEPFVRRQLLEPCHLGHDDDISPFQGVHQLRLEQVPAGRVRARFEDPPESSSGKFHPQCPQRLADGGGMVSEVVHHHHAAGFAPDVHPAFHALERRERLLDLGVGQPAMARTGGHRERVADVQFPNQRDLEAGIPDLEA